MTLNGKRDGFTTEDFRACAKSALMKRGRAKAIVEEVQGAAKCWPEFAAKAQVEERWRDQIQESHRLSLPKA